MITGMRNTTMSCDGCGATLPSAFSTQCPECKLAAYDALTLLQDVDDTFDKVAYRIFLEEGE